MANDSQIFMDLLKNKEEVVKAVIDDISQSQVISRELQGISSSIGHRDPSDVLRALVKCNARLSKTVLRLGVIALVYAQGDQFSADNAKALTKMGRGKEAIKAFYESKFGKFVR